MSGSSSTTRICDMKYSGPRGFTRQPDDRCGRERRPQVRRGRIRHGGQRLRRDVERNARSTKRVRRDLERDAAEYSLVSKPGERRRPAVAEDQGELVPGSDERVLLIETGEVRPAAFDQVVARPGHRLEEPPPHRVLGERSMDGERVLSNQRGDGRGARGPLPGRA